MSLEQYAAWRPLPLQDEDGHGERQEDPTQGGTMIRHAFRGDALERPLARFLVPPGAGLGFDLLIPRGFYDGGGWFWLKAAASGDPAGADRRMSLKRLKHGVWQGLSLALPLSSQDRATEFQVSVETSAPAGGKLYFRAWKALPWEPGAWLAELRRSAGFGEAADPEWRFDQTLRLNESLGEGVLKAFLDACGPRPGLLGIGAGAGRWARAAGTGGRRDFFDGEDALQRAALNAAPAGGYQAAFLDGSLPLNELMLAAFLALPALAPGGWLVVEGLPGLSAEWLDSFLASNHRDSVMKAGPLDTSKDLYRKIGDFVPKSWELFEDF